MAIVVDIPVIIDWPKAAPIARPSHKLCIKVLIIRIQAVDLIFFNLKEQNFLLSLSKLKDWIKRF